jgi:two-component system NtrC family sensor kinase
MPDGGNIRINLSDKNNPIKEIRIEVADTGTGINQEDMDKLFTPFFTTKPIGMGTGLGLATIYGIIKMHKGKIEVKSNPDVEKGPTGTSFIITIPIRKRIEE